MKPPYRVLVTEDDPFIRKILRQTLKDDFDVITKENGIEAVSWLEEGNLVDIILTDIQMPYLDGKDLLRTLRSSSSFQRIPIIILSSLTDTETRVKFLNLGADDYIIKPFSPIEVKTKINAVLRRIEASNSGPS